MRNLKSQENKLFAYLFKFFKVKTDSQLAEQLYTSGANLSRVRNDHKYLSAKLILIIYDKTDLSIEEIRKMAKEHDNKRQVFAGSRVNTK
jgi:hypothetical protein